MVLDVMDLPGTQVVQEAERRRIARELHDGAVQSLTALVADLEFFRTSRLTVGGDANHEIAERLGVWQELARESLLSMRQTLGGLRAQGDFDSGLEAAVRALLLEVQSRRCSVALYCDGWPAQLPFEYSSNLYYILREALINCRKHAQASHINVFMYSEEGQLRISVRDDGVGMAVPGVPVAADNGYGQGLIGLRERVTLLGGRLSIESWVGKGTRVDVGVPLP